MLLAYEMNGQPLPKIHGYPLRVVVAGYIGARSAKWVYRINALEEPSMGPVQRQEYLYYTSQVRCLSERERCAGEGADGWIGVCRLGSRTQSTRMGSRSRTCLCRAYRATLDCCECLPTLL